MKIISEIACAIFDVTQVRRDCLPAITFFMRVTSQSKSKEQRLPSRHTLNSVNAKPGHVVA
jgi:hypothetical protein